MSTLHVEIITRKIFEIRGQKVMLDTDLAGLYGVTTKALNQAVKRNLRRFPKDLMFSLTKKEKAELVTNCDQLTKLKHSSVLPNAFTETGVAMLSSVLNSERAIRINLQIMRAFVKLRKIVQGNDALRYAIEGLEKRVCKNERHIQIALQYIQKILLPEPKPIPKKTHKMGFSKD